MPGNFDQFLLFVWLLTFTIIICQNMSNFLCKPPALFTQPPHTHDVLWTSSWPYDKGRGEVKRKKQENNETTHFSSWWQKKCLQNPSSVWKLSAHWSGDRTLLLLSESASAEKRCLVGKAPQAWRLLNQLSLCFCSDLWQNSLNEIWLLLIYHQTPPDPLFYWNDFKIVAIS